MKKQLLYFPTFRILAPSLPREAILISSKERIIVFPKILVLAPSFSEKKSYILQIKQLLNITFVPLCDQ